MTEVELNLNKILVPKVQLVLRSASIFTLTSGGNTYSTTSPFAPFERTIDQTTSVGFLNRWQSSMRWDNINFSELLGHHYEQNGLYCLKLESVTFGLTSNLTTYSASENNRNFNIFIGGLGFINGKTENLLCSVRVPNGSQAYIFNYSKNELYFHLDSELKNITIQYKDFLLDSNEPVGSTNTVAYPHVQFVFSLSRVE